MTYAKIDDPEGAEIDYMLFCLEQGVIPVPGPCSPRVKRVSNMIARRAPQSRRYTDLQEAKDVGDRLMEKYRSHSSAVSIVAYVEGVVDFVSPTSVVDYQIDTRERWVKIQCRVIRMLDKGEDAVKALHEWRLASGPVMPPPGWGVPPHAASSAASPEEAKAEVAPPTAVEVASRLTVEEVAAASSAPPEALPASVVEQARAGAAAATRLEGEVRRILRQTENEALELSRMDAGRAEIDAANARATKAGRFFVGAQMAALAALDLLEFLENEGVPAEVEPEVEP